MSALARAETTPPRTRLHDLIELAAEPSSTRRRELLREITDAFFMTLETHGPAEQALFDEILTRLSAEMEAEVQAELAERMAASERAPRSLVRSLACADIAIARPLLADSPALREDDLIHVVDRAPQEHLRLVSARSDIGPALSDAIIRKADDDTLKVLVQNERAELSREGSEAAVTRARVNPDLHAAVVGRRSLPLDLLNEMYFVVEARLRETITQRNESVDPATLEAALAASRRRLAERDGALPKDYAEAEAHVRKLKRSNGLTGPALVGFLRAGERLRFLAALCELTDIDFHTARRIVERKDLDALAVVCKAADFDRPLFLTFAVLIADAAEGMGRASEYGKLFAELPKETALRTLRFWRVRRVSAAGSAPSPEPRDA